MGTVLEADRTDAGTVAASPRARLFDCHAHVYERVYAAVAQPRYLPATPAPRQVWIERQRENDVDGGVIVQISFFGTDNSEMLEALKALGTDRFRGVAVVGFDATEDELQALRLQGVRGVRWNLVAGAPLPDLADAWVRGFLKRLNRTGLHLQIQLESHRLGPYLYALTSLVDCLVIDHFGIPTSPMPKAEPWILAFKDIGSASNVWVKFSAPYRSPVDVSPHAQEILELIGPGRVVWGSDWPWTNHEGRHSYADTRAWMGRWLDEAYWAHIERASRQLYGFSPD
jgi:predicted TIM-barrel fold metal-dependent hydrolase